MKKYFLQRFSNKHKYIVSRSTAAAHDGGQNIGPFKNFEEAKAAQKVENEKVEQQKSGGEIPE